MASESDIDAMVSVVGDKESRGFFNSLIIKHNNNVGEALDAYFRGDFGTLQGTPQGTQAQLPRTSTGHSDLGYFDESVHQRHEGGSRAAHYDSPTQGSSKAQEKTEVSLTAMAPDSLSNSLKTYKRMALPKLFMAEPSEVEDSYPSSGTARCFFPPQGPSTNKGKAKANKRVAVPSQKDLMRRTSMAALIMPQFRSSLASGSTEKLQIPIASVNDDANTLSSHAPSTRERTVPSEDSQSSHHCGSKGRGISLALSQHSSDGGTIILNPPGSDGNGLNYEIYSSLDSHLPMPTRPCSKTRQPRALPGRFDEYRAARPAMDQPKSWDAASKIDIYGDAEKFKHGSEVSQRPAVQISNDPDTFNTVGPSSSSIAKCCPACSYELNEPEMTFNEAMKLLDLQDYKSVDHQTLLLHKCLAFDTENDTRFSNHQDVSRAFHTIMRDHDSKDCWKLRLKWTKQKDGELSQLKAQGSEMSWNGIARILKTSKKDCVKRWNIIKPKDHRSKSSRKNEHKRTDQAMKEKLSLENNCPATCEMPRACQLTSDTTWNFLGANYEQPSVDNCTPSLHCNTDHNNMWDSHSHRKSDSSVAHNANLYRDPKAFVSGQEQPEGEWVTSWESGRWGVPPKKHHTFVPRSKVDEIFDSSYHDAGTIYWTDEPEKHHRFARKAKIDHKQWGEMSADKVVDSSHASYEDANDWGFFESKESSTSQLKKKVDDQNASYAANYGLADDHSVHNQNHGAWDMLPGDVVYKSDNTDWDHISNATYKNQEPMFDLATSPVETGGWDGSPIRYGSNPILDSSLHATTRSPAADRTYTVTYWATIETVKDKIQIPIKSTNVSGPEKDVIEGNSGLKKVWKWVQDKSLGDRIGLQEVYDLASAMNEEQTNEKIQNDDIQNPSVLETDSMSDFVGQS